MVKINDVEKHKYSNWFTALRLRMMEMIERIESEFADNYKFECNIKFDTKKWHRVEGGGGEIGILNGNVFEKIGINISTVFGKVNPMLNLPGATENSEFWASGLSTVSHPRNPFIPPIHMNTRCISTRDKIWFGGALDLNPIMSDEEEKYFFHSEIKALCDKYNSEYYEKFSKWCDEYFWLAHRNEPRGIGGIFFDYIDSTENNFEFLKAIGELYITLYDKIVRRKINNGWTSDDREYQLLRRGRYAEFNLIYDRGIKFGLMTGGNPDGMMMSLPPLVKWK